jgi:Fic family protein
MLEDSEGTSGRQIRIEWRGRSVSAWIPGKLVHGSQPRTLPLTEPTIRKTERAANLCRDANAALPISWVPIARLLARSEGIASSFFEGLQAPITDVALAVSNLGGTGTALAVAENVIALASAMDERPEQFSLAMLHNWHQILMSHANYLPTEMIGAFRTEQGWIGGTSPLDAALVTPPPEFIGELMIDLELYINSQDVDPITQAAVAHAQFETIHPYGDGNGRVGRVLVAWMLAQRLELNSAPPLSTHLSRDRGGYLSGLVLFQQDQSDSWVRWFADTVARSATSSIAITNQVQELLAKWESLLGGMRSDAVARRILTLFPERFVVTAHDVVDATGVSDRSARSALEELHRRGITEQLVAHTESLGRPAKLWVAPELGRIVGAL